MKPFSLASFFPRPFQVTDELAAKYDEAARALAPIPVRRPKQQPYNVGRNDLKRSFKRFCAIAKGKEGGWKKRVRLLMIRAKQDGHKL